MAGHSHWAGIKHKKGKADKQRSKIFSKLSKEIIINSPSILRENQSEFAKTGGIHASGLFSSNGSLIIIPSSPTSRRY